LQYLLCILGIALGVAMLVSIDLASGSAQRAFSLSTDAITGRTTHRLVAIGPGGVPDSSFVALRRRFPEIPAAPVIEAYGRAEELDGELLRVVGVDLFSEAPFRGLLGGDGNGQGGRGQQGGTQKTQHHAQGSPACQLFLEHQPGNQGAKQGSHGVQNR
jgi:putative ABC transport system permease protein